jgi:hypothetical protein
VRLVTGWHQQERPGPGAGRPVADVGEVVGPGVDELEHVVAAAGVRHLQPHRAGAQVELGDRVDGVVVDRHEPALGPGQRGGVAEAVERRGRHPTDAVVREAVDLL